jgi:hypothetical protein
VNPSTALPTPVHIHVGGPPPAHLLLWHGRRPYPVAMTRPGSTRAWRRLRAYVLQRDALTCQACTPPHPLTTHDRTLPTHATLGHRPGREWALTRATSLDPDDYRAECAAWNYSEGARFGNASRTVTPSSYYTDPDW